MKAFELSLLANPTQWTPVGYKLADGIAAKMNVNAASFIPFFLFEGTLREGAAPVEGPVEIAKVYFRAAPFDGGCEGIPGDEPYYEGETPYGDLPYNEEILDGMSFGLNGQVTDSEGTLHLLWAPSFQSVSVANPDVDADGDVDEADVTDISAWFGKRKDGTEDEAFYNYDMNGNGVIDMNDITFVYMRWKREGVDPDVPPSDLLDFVEVEVPV